MKCEPFACVFVSALYSTALWKSLFSLGRKPVLLLAPKTLASCVMPQECQQIQDGCGVMHSLSQKRLKGETANGLGSGDAN